MNSQLVILGKALQKEGYRLTAARRSILEALVDSGGHISADGLVEAVRQIAPGVGRMTVYRTLELLSELGLIRPVYQGTGAAHYILMENGHHHHLICSNCDRVIEFEDCLVEELARALGGRFNFNVQGHLIELYGLCQTCRAS